MVQTLLALSAIPSNGVNIMNASDLMTTAVKTCTLNDDLQRVAQIMWEGDCGIVPVLDSDERVTGVITDRDVCMAACMQGKPLWQIPVLNAMAQKVYGVLEDDSVEFVEALMRKFQVRRVPVLDSVGRLRGILSMNDLARHAHRSGFRKSDGLSGDNIVETLAAICGPHVAPPSKDQSFQQAAQFSV